MRFLLALALALSLGASARAQCPTCVRPLLLPRRVVLAVPVVAVAPVAVACPCGDEPAASAKPERFILVRMGLINVRARAALRREHRQERRDARRACRGCH